MSCLLVLAHTSPASAATGTQSGSPWISSSVPAAAVRPLGWHLSPRQAVGVGDRVPAVEQLLHADPGVAVSVRAAPSSSHLWEITWSHGATTEAIVYLDDATGRIVQSATGAPAKLANTIPLGAWSGTKALDGSGISPRRVIASAVRSSRLRAALREHPDLIPAAWPTAVPNRWRIDWFRGTTDTVLAYYDVRTHAVTGVFTGRALTWALGRGDPIYTGDTVGAWYVWLPLCLLFLLPFFDPKRPLRLLHLDLLALLAFSASTVFFDHGNLSASVPLIYPVLAYLFVRLLIAGLRPRQRAGALIPLASERLLLAGIVLLTVVRVVLNVTGSTPLDVGTASYTGAQQLLHGVSPYNGILGHLVPGGDTYGPVTYLAYVPFALAFPHTHGAAFPGAHAAAIFYDLVTTVCLVLLGIRLRGGRQGRVLGLALGYAWVAYPYTAFTLMENTNDSLVACLMVLTLLVLASPARRGLMLGLAALTKFFPLALVPLLATGGGPVRRRAWAVFGAALVVVLMLTVLPLTGSFSNLHGFYSRTLAYQLGRTSPLSIWGQYPALVALQRVLEVGTVLLALSLALIPRLRSHAQVAALSACVIIATEICASYWYYTYIVWFAPAAFLALFLQYRSQTSSGTGANELPEPDLLEPPLAEAVA